MYVQRRDLLPPCGLRCPRRSWLLLLDLRILRDLDLERDLVLDLFDRCLSLEWLRLRLCLDLERDLSLRISRLDLSLRLLSLL